MAAVSRQLYQSRPPALPAAPRQHPGPAGAGGGGGGVLQSPSSATRCQGRGAWALERQGTTGGDAGAAGDGGAYGQVREGVCGGSSAGVGVEDCPVGAREGTCRAPVRIRIANYRSHAKVFCKCLRIAYTLLDKIRIASP